MANIIVQQQVKTTTGYDNLIPNMAYNSTNATNIPPDHFDAVNPNGRGNASEVGPGSIAFGQNAVASNSHTVVVGFDASATGLFSIAIGSGASAPGSSTLAVGDGATASTQYNIAIGHSASASGATGLGSVAIGANAKATATNATAMGGASIASKAGSTALGANATAKGEFSTALGANAKTSDNDDNIIQIGSQAGISNVYGGAAYSVRSDIRDKADIMTIDGRKSLDFLLKIEPIQYVRNNREKYLLTDDDNKKLYFRYGMCEYDRVAHEQGTKKGTRKNVGVKAQQVYQALIETFGSDNFANIVSDNLYDAKAKGENPLVENKYTVAYSNFVPFLIGAIQEQQKQIDELKNRILALENK